MAISLRKVDFDLKAAAGHWNGGSPFRTHFFNALSVMLPEGEKFFIEIAARIVNQSMPEELRRDTAGFVAQESSHSVQHRRYNEAIAAAGFNIPALEQAVAKQITLMKRLLSRTWLAAVAAAYEHMTAMLGETVLSTTEWLENADAEFARLWRWHSVEEIEHKSVAFDLYKATGGGYLVRVAAMAFASLAFTINLVWLMLYFGGKDRSLLRPRAWSDGLAFLFWRAGLFTRLLPAYLRYFAPSFHPDQNDQSHLIAQWSAREPGAD